MSQSRIGSFLFLPTSSTRVHAGAYSEAGQAWAGITRWTYEHATGAPAVAGEAPAAPLNPQGELGADLSGPPFGAAPRHCVAWWLGDSSSTGASPSRSPANPWTALDDVEERQQVFVIWNRPHAEREDGQAPYQRLQLTWRGVQSAGTSTVWRIRIVNQTLGGRAVTTTRTIATTTDSSYAETTLVPMAAGRNTIAVSFVRQSGAANTLNVTTLALANVVKRRHGVA